VGFYILVPEKVWKLGYGYYSNVCRGRRKKESVDKADSVIEEDN